MAVKKQSSETSASGAQDDVDAGWDLESGWDEEPAKPPNSGFEPVPPVLSYVSESSIPPEVAPAALSAPTAPVVNASAIVTPQSVPPSAPIPRKSESGTLRPAELEVVQLPMPQKSAAWPKWAAAAVMVLAAGAGFARIDGAQHTAGALAQPTAAIPTAAIPTAAKAPESAALPAPAAVAAPAPAPAEPTAPEAAPTPAPAPEAATTREVTVSVSPKGSIIFDHGKRIGTDVVHVTVEAGQSKRLVALRDGYLPKKFSVESSDTDVHITLKPAADAANFPVTPSAPAASAR